MDKAKILNLMVLSFFLFQTAFSQEVTVKGYFQQDSAKLGERVGYVLKAEYPTELPILFPDSTFRFGSMEFLEKQTFPSITQDGITTDSAVYFLSNFSLDSIKNYSLPVFEILKYDSISHYPETAELKLMLTIAEIPDTLTFRENDTYQSIKQPFNYPYLLLALALVVIILVVLVYFFGKKLKDRWRIYLEKKRWKRFVINWEASKQSLIKEPSIHSADELLGLWKGYLENLTGKPFKEWTATEISSYLNNPEILKDFRKIELIIYANRVGEDVNLACDKLLHVSNEILDNRINKILQEHE